MRTPPAQWQQLQGREEEGSARGQKPPWQTLGCRAAEFHQSCSESSTVQGYGKVKANPPCDGFTPAIATGCRRLVKTMDHPRVCAVLAGPQPRPPPLPGLSPRAGLVPESRGLAQGRVFRGPHGCAPPTAQSDPATQAPAPASVSPQGPVTPGQSCCSSDERPALARRDSQSRQDAALWLPNLSPLCPVSQHQSTGSRPSWTGHGDGPLPAEASVCLLP